VQHIVAVVELDRLARAYHQDGGDERLLDLIHVHRRAVGRLLGRALRLENQNGREAADRRRQLAAQCVRSGIPRLCRWRQSGRLLVVGRRGV
jgi:hypothetical protein